tara:strand:+ start:18977 stop:21238 length:2262 start_codon:yes stop_codon:yes gene_type:complete
MHSKAALESITRLFNIPPRFAVNDYSGRLSLFIECLLQTKLCSLELTETLKNTLTELQKDNCESDKSYQRKDLYSYLKSHPLFSTLMLINESEESADSMRLFMLLARLFLLRGSDDYDAFLQFYKCFLHDRNSRVELTLEFLRDAMSDELHVELEKIAELKGDSALTLFCRFMTARKYRAWTEKNIGPLTTANEHEYTLIESNSESVSYCEMSDELAHEKGEFLKRAPKVELTEEQERHKFKRKKAGLRNALYNSALNSAWSMNAATPAELGKLLDALTPAVRDGQFSQLKKEKAGFLSVFFLRLLVGAQVSHITLNNLAAKTNIKNSADPVLSYELDRQKRHISAELTLNSALLETHEPQAPKFHYANNTRITLQLSFPIPQILNVTIRNITASKRHDENLFTALELSQNDYSNLFSRLLKTSLLKKRGITRRAVESSFEHFAVERLPETFRSFLKGKAGVQNHYISAERSLIEQTTQKLWLQFCESIGFEKIAITAAESASTLGSRFAYHDEVGSKITLREEVLSAIISQLANDSVANHSSPESMVTSLKTAALYIYLRVASTVGLRPVSEPFPPSKQFNSNLGVMSVSDKRAHHSDERRLIVLPDVQVELIIAFQKVARALSRCLQVDEPQSIVMDFNADTLSWEHFSQSHVNQLLQQRVGQPLINHSFRHSAARRFLYENLNSGTFKQSELDLLMNHSRAGVSNFNMRSLVNLRELVKQQRTRIEPYDNEFEHDDARVLNKLTTLSTAL